MRHLILLSVVAALSLLSQSQSLFIDNNPVLDFSEDVEEGGSGGFRERGLRVHNYFRKQYHVPPLQLDQELNKLAHAHAEKLATWDNMTASNLGFAENLWSHRGELLPLAKDVSYAVRCWYTGSTAPGGTAASIDHDTLRSDFFKYVGFGVGTSDHGGQGYSIVVALYDFE